MKAVNKNLKSWYTSYNEVVRFGRDLFGGNMFDVPFPNQYEHETADNMLLYFEKPWHWNREYLWWVANDWPDDEASWERGRDTEWEIT